MQLLSKSKYLYGIQCHNLLWMSINEPEKMPKIDEVVQARFDQGKLVGELAKKLFPEGIDIDEDDFEENLKKSSEFLSLGKPLFEAAFLKGMVYSRADILLPSKDGSWDIIEVKSSGSPKEMHFHDLAFQKYCYEKFGLKINDCSLMLINTSYVKNGDIDPKELFKIVNVNEEVKKASEGIAKRVISMIELMYHSHKYKACGNCLGPDDCPLPHECWSFLPEHHIFHLHRGGKKALELFEAKVYSIKDIPSNVKLSVSQLIQKKCESNGSCHVDVKELNAFLDSLAYPLYFLDFETLSTAIPIYDGTKPYQQIPFQFSLHYVEAPGSKAAHHSFLAKEGDPRDGFIKELKKKLGHKGSIVVYNQSFEKGILKAFPGTDPIIDRFVDLLAPFRSFHYYHPKQKGSHSMKKVLPALTGKSYADLEIAGGESASQQYLYSMFGSLDGKKPTHKEIEEIRKNLEKYCSLDTEGMVEILNVLRVLV